MNIRKLDIRTLTPQQFEQIVAIEQNCGLEPYSPEMLMDCIDNLDTFACLDGDTVAGFITILPYSRRMGGGLYIVNLNVAKNYQRQGLGQKLILTACTAYADSHKGCFVTLDVTKNNTSALRLYEKLGFTLTDIPSRNGDTDVVMVAELNRLIKGGKQLP